MSRTGRGVVFSCVSVANVCRGPLIKTPSLLLLSFSRFFSKNTHRQNVLRPQDMFRLSCPSHSWFVNINLLPQNPPWNLMQNGRDSHAFIQLSHLRAIVAKLAFSTCWHVLIYWHWRHSNKVIAVLTFIVVLNKVPAPQKKSWEIRPEKEGRILSKCGVLKQNSRSHVLVFISDLWTIFYNQLRGKRLNVYKNFLSFPMKSNISYIFFFFTAK